MRRSDRHLVQRAKRGDGDAFAELTSPFHQKLFETACFLANDRDEAEDLIQECLIRAYRSIRRFREDAPILPWLLKILRNLFIDSRRSARHKYEVCSFGSDLDHADKAGKGDPTADWGKPVDADALETLLRKEREAELRRCIAALPSDFALVLVLVDIQGFSYAEAAEATGVPVNTVRTRLLRARIRLRREILFGSGNS